MSKASRAVARKRAGRGWLWPLGGGAVVFVALVLIARTWVLAPVPAATESNNVKGSQTAAVEVEEWGDFG